MKRRTFLAAMAASAATPLVRAQTRGAPTKIVVGFPPGGGTDAVARVLAAKLAERWGSPVMVENRAGAASVIAASYVAKQPADGSTLLMTNISNHAIAPSLYPALEYDVKRDFTPVVLVGVTPLLLIGNAQQPAANVAQLAEQCRKDPGAVRFGSAGVGSSQHLALEMFKLQAKVDALHVPYRGSGPMVTDLLGGQIDYSFETMASATPLGKAGKVKVLAQTRAKRAKGFPDVPTVAEQGYPGFDASTWYGLVGPRGMDPGKVRDLNRDLNEVLAMPDVVAQMDNYGAEDGGDTPEKFAAFIDSEIAKWARVIRDAHVQAT